MPGALRCGIQRASWLANWSPRAQRPNGETWETWGETWGQEDVKKSIWPKSKLMQNVCRRPSDRLPCILAAIFLEPKFRHTNFSISSHLPDEITPETPDAFDDVG
jgi:hypothetical protein